MIAAAERRVVCVTGGTGFIGGHLVRALDDAGDSSIKVLSRGGREGIDEALWSATGVHGDLLDEDAVCRFVSPGSAVVNLAFARGAPPGINRKMAANLAAACVAAPAAHVIHCSTAVVTGRPDIDIVDETVPCRPVTSYQASKLEIEQLLAQRLAGCCPLTVLRPTAVFGVGGNNLCSLIDGLVERAWLLNLLSATLFARRRLHLVSVDNVVAAIRFVLSAGAELANEVFIVSDDEAPENNYREVLNIAARELGVRPFPSWRLPCGEAVAERALRLAGRPDPNPRRIFSSRKLRDRGFRPPMELAEAVAGFARAYSEEAACR